jgi:ABC-type microcin C transport system permease subunit YejE
MFKFYLENICNRYFPSVRGIVLLIVLPAFFIIIFQFISSFIEIVIAKEHSIIVDYEKRFAPLKKDLPKHAFVNYFSNQDYSGDYFAVRYALIPVRLIRGLKPRHSYLVVHFSDPTKTPRFDGYALNKDYGNGIMLFSRSGD